jgi:hypothetical protein
MPNCQSARDTDKALSLDIRWDFGGDAIIVSVRKLGRYKDLHKLVHVQNTNKHVRLTQDRRSEMGWLWSRLPLKAQNYEIEVEFNASQAHGVC